MAVGVAALGTLAFWGECLLYPLVAFTNAVRKGAFTLDVLVPFDKCTSSIGLLLIVLGLSIFSWSVQARGRYATSWAMAEDHRLVTWGPYRFVRHPSYLSYFMMFFGMLILWPNVFSTIPILSIPGYVRITKDEEGLLIERFGDQYRDYRKRTGRFFPKIPRKLACA
ncbi:MAG: isoprenylcysteine carboxylmethyltransferase family protein [Candidatus Brockarchaeota archaeon]|nr:isoprenylcysteine carboxylmethyltransferase family protein [Candidatus Brockarchaeota archaeon]